MSGLRSEWTPEQVQEHLGEANEGLPEARTVDRFAVPGTAGGVDLQAGEQAYEEGGADRLGDRPMPPDPPRSIEQEGGR